MGRKPLVSVCCLTYNHESYIRQCLNGFIMQKTMFPIEILIHDDASTDGTTKIIKEYEKRYPKLIKPIYQKVNQYSRAIDNIELFNISRAAGKYIATCEGDDYWIDPLKLQKQVDFLQNNPEYGLCYTQALQFDQRKGKMLKEKRGTWYYPFDQQLYYGIPAPYLTYCYRKNLFFQYQAEVKPKGKKWIAGDIPLILWMSLNSKLYFFSEITAVYRIVQGSASKHFAPYNIRVAALNNSRGIYEYFAKKSGIAYDREKFNFIYFTHYAFWALKCMDFSAYKEEYNKSYTMLATRPYLIDHILARSRLLFLLYSLLFIKFKPAPHGRFSHLINSYPFYKFIRSVYRQLVPKTIREKLWKKRNIASGQEEKLIQRTFVKDFKEKVVRMAQTERWNITSIADELGIDVNIIHRWKRECQKDLIDKSLQNKSLRYPILVPTTDKEVDICPKISLK